MRAFFKSSNGVAATEFALVLPVLVSMLLGTIDLGRALWVSHKMLGATQTVADIITRNEIATNFDIQDAITAAEMVMDPFPMNEVGYDIVGIRFNQEDAEIRWRETVNMDADRRFPGLADGLGDHNEGVVAVVMQYSYQPAFYGFVIGEVNLQETAILRGRRVPYVAREF